MRTILRIELTAPGKYDEVTREFDLPFAPFVGLQLQFSSILTDHPNARRYKEAMKKNGLINVAICNIERVLYRVEDQSFLVIASETFDSTERLDAAVEQYVLGYEFMRG